MVDELIFIPNDDTQNYPFCRLKLVVETFYTRLDKPIKIHKKVVEPRNKKNIIKKLWGLV